MLTRVPEPYELGWKKESFVKYSFKKMSFECPEHCVLVVLSALSHLSGGRDAGEVRPVERRRPLHTPGCVPVLIVPGTVEPVGAQLPHTLMRTWAYLYLSVLL